MGNAVTFANDRRLCTMLVGQVNTSSRVPTVAHADTDAGAEVEAGEDGFLSVMSGEVGLCARVVDLAAAVSSMRF